MTFVSPLLKIPCILAVGIACHVAWTPPVPVQSGVEERVPPQEWGESFLRLLLRILPVNGLTIIKVGNIVSSRWKAKMESRFQTTWWTIAVLETGTIMAQNFAQDSLLNVDKSVLSGLSRAHLRMTPRATTGMTLVLFGAWLRWWCYRVLKTHFTFVHTFRKDHKLVTRAPYSIVRHPGYAGMVAVHVGLALWHGSPGSWVRESGVLETAAGSVYAWTFWPGLWAVLAALLSRMYEEDASLKENFGEEWELYAKRVQYRLIPGVL